MLTMINQNAEGEFGGVLFLYAATPDFRSMVIQPQYIALQDRIGSIAFTPGQPMTPLIKLDDIYSDETTKELGFRLLEVFERAGGATWDREIQARNAETLIEAQKRRLGFVRTVPPRYFVYHWCRLLSAQERAERRLSIEDATQFIEGHPLSDGEPA